MNLAEVGVKSVRDCFKKKKQQTTVSENSGMEHHFTSFLLCCGGNLGEILVNGFLSLRERSIDSSARLSVGAIGRV